MTLEDLTGQYRLLRQALHEAYGAPVWDAGRIDRIAQAMLPLERALAQRGSGTVPSPADGWALAPARLAEGAGRQAMP